MVFNNLRKVKLGGLFLLTGFFVMFSAAVGLLGWLVGIEAFKSILPYYPTLKFNTAMCFMILGAAFSLFIKAEIKVLKIVSYTLLIVLGIISAITLAQDLFNFSAGIDQWAIKDMEMIKAHGAFPGRMSPPSSLSFFLMSISLLGLSIKNHRINFFAQYGLHLVSLIAFISVIGFLLSVPYTPKLTFFSSMAINTSATFLLISVVAANLNRNLGIMRVFAGEEIGNIIARKLFPRLIIILLICAYTSMWLQRHQFISPEFGELISIVLFVFAALFLFRGVLRNMNSLDFKKSAAEDEIRLLNKNLEETILKRTSELKLSNDLFVKIFNSNPAGIAISKVDTGEYRNVNPALLSILKYTKEEMIGRLSTDLLVINAETRQHLMSILVSEGRPANIEMTLKDKNGSTKHCLVTMEKFVEHDQQYMMSFIYDITDRKNAEEKLAIAYQETEGLAVRLTGRNKQLLSFAHITSHNLRSPVSNLNMLLLFYKENTSAEDQQQLIEKIDTVVNHLTTTLDELLETISIQENTEKKRQELYFDQIFKSVTDILIGELLESKAVIKSDFLKAPVILYPKVYLESILLNLVSNAIKYRSPDRIPEITIITELVNGETVLTVTDNGLGIDLDMHGKNLFGMRKTFHRHPNAKGLGLFIVKTQVEAMGGEISAKSEVEKGTTFKIIFNKLES
ncbi:PAS domain S-box-containing protein [Pedobacter sp. UYP24]